ncbi:hypothetical protein NPIL_28571 [Nephila pilipes]|uniref:Uncharacterized protein n=1 Tax=Nephila pilipes TaxID=299642 RepID=A0A8X6UUM8_NEPPI|nr:hypothetical protein NPIL_28571 [Nephila pilipes]
MCPDECVLLIVDGLSGLLGASPLSPSLASEKRSSACEACCWNLVPCGSLVSLAFSVCFCLLKCRFFPVFCCVPSLVDVLLDDLNLPAFYFTCVLWTFRTTDFHLGRFRPEDYLSFCNLMSIFSAILFCIPYL